jgi:hypothetical protein
MLKTFTILLTASDKLTVDGIESAVLHGMPAVDGPEGDMRVDAFEGDHTTPGSMDDTRANVLTIARKGHADMRAPKPRAWADLTRDEQAGTLRAAEEVGGGFVSHLATAWRRADSSNSAKLGEAFGAMLVEHYGPGTPAYGSVN